MSEPESNRFADPAFWVVVILCGLLLYLFVYPPVIMLLNIALDILSIDFIGATIDFSVIPLEWLVDNLPVYQTYLDFVAERLYP